MIRRIILPFFVLLWFCSCNSQKYNENLLVVLSMDGFRWDYPEKVPTPNLDSIAAYGVKAKRFIPSFPTTTFASHYTMATGLHPDKHGILANRFYAPDLDADFNKGDRTTVEDGKFYGGEPIWVTAEMQNLKTATFYWVGSEADVQGIRPTYWKQYDHDFPYGQRIDTVIYWLGLPEEMRPRLVMWYFDEPDSSGHRYGPESDSVKSVIARLDSLVGVFLKKMLALPHAEKINFIIVSDHGMAELSPEREIFLDKHIDTSMIVLVDGSNPTMNIKVKDGYLDDVYESMKQIENMSVWKHGEVPERLQHGTHIRTHDLILLADKGYSISWSWRPNRSKATHGFDNALEDMHAIFYAIGPDFKINYKAHELHTVDLYSLMAYLLKLQPAEGDGNFERISNVIQ